MNSLYTRKTLGHPPPPPSGSLSRRRGPPSVPLWLDKPAMETTQAAAWRCTGEGGPALTSTWLSCCSSPPRSTFPSSPTWLHRLRSLDSSPPRRQCIKGVLLMFT